MLTRPLFVYPCHQGRSDGGYIGIYTPLQSVYLKLFYVVVLSPRPRTNSFIPTQIKFLDTPLHVTLVIQHFVCRRRARPVLNVCVGQLTNESLRVACRVKRRSAAETTTSISSYLCRSVTRPSVTSARNLFSTSLHYSVKVRTTDSCMLPHTTIHSC